MEVRVRRITGVQISLCMYYGVIAADNFDKSHAEVSTSLKNDRNACKNAVLCQRDDAVVVRLKDVSLITAPGSLPTKASCSVPQPLQAARQLSEQR